MKKPPYRILFTNEAKKNVEKLDPSIAKIVGKAIGSLAVNPAKGKPLAYELAGLRSLRTSDYERPGSKLLFTHPSPRETCVKSSFDPGFSP